MSSAQPLFSLHIWSEPDKVGTLIDSTLARKATKAFQNFGPLYEEKTFGFYLNHQT
jgi:hypothetical protein